MPTLVGMWDGTTCAERREIRQVVSRDLRRFRVFFASCSPNWTLADTECPVQGILGSVELAGFEPI